MDSLEWTPAREAEVRRWIAARSARHDDETPGLTDDLASAIAEIDRLRGACRALVAEKDRLGTELARANLDLAELALQSRVGPPPALQDEADRAAGRRRARRRK